MKYRKQRNQSFHPTTPTQIAPHLKHHQERSASTKRNLRKRSKRLLQSRRSRNPRRRSNPPPLILTKIHLKPSQLKRDQELPLTLLLPVKVAPTKLRKLPKRLLFQRRNPRLSLLPILIPQTLISQHQRKPLLKPRLLQAHLDLLQTPISQHQRKLLLKPTHHLDLDLTPALMIKKRPRPQLLKLQLLRLQLLLMSTMVNLNSSFKDSPSIPMRIA
jgi:hypothetical protein